MSKLVEVDFWEIEEKPEYAILAEKVLDKCFEIENMQDKNLYINVLLTNPNKIKEINSKYRNIDKETDVLSFPMFEKSELINLKQTCHEDTLGDIIISIEQVKKQAIEYEHSFEREFSYMLVHGFYHLMGYDHIEEKDKIEMRNKEENVLSLLKLERK